MSIVKFNKTELDIRFNEIYENYSSSIYKFCLSKLNCNEEYAQDCTQETFLVFYERLKAGEQFENERAFLYKTALNFVRRKHSEIQRTNDNETNIDEFAEILGTREDNYSNLDFEQITKQIDFLLTDEEKTIYTMRFVDEARVSDIAKFLNITADNCSVKILRLKKKLREKLIEYI